MRKTLLIGLAALLLAGCTSRTEYGECIGLADDKKPDLTYKVSAWNVGMGIVFVETIFVPIFVVVDQTFCPVGKKT